MAVAGFTMKDLNITTQREALIVSGKAEEKDDQGVNYLHRGIAARAFQRTFRLADHIKVTGAEMHDGLLTINLVHEVPEEAKPRMISINSNGSTSIAPTDTSKPPTCRRGKTTHLATADKFLVKRYFLPKQELRLGDCV
jgi:hypothetical protein